MSATRPKINKKLASVNEKAEAGHVEEVLEISNSFARVGRTTIKPETKYSYANE